MAFSCYTSPVPQIRISANSLRINREVLTMLSPFTLQSHFTEDSPIFMPKNLFSTSLLLKPNTKRIFLRGFSNSKSVDWCIYTIERKRRLDLFDTSAGPTTIRLIYSWRQGAKSLPLHPLGQMLLPLSLHLHSGISRIDLGVKSLIE